LEETLGFERRADGEWEVRGDKRGGFYRYDAAPADAPRPGGGTVHHIAWATEMNEQEAWRERVAQAGANPTPVIDRFWFRSVYFREPNGILFELATMGPGFTTDEDPEHLGEKLVLPPNFEHLRDKIEHRLTPLPDPRATWSRR
jgi:glyoxalase family protein